MPLKLTTYYRGKDIPDLPGTNTFHSKELFQIYESTPGYTPLLIVATEEGRPVARLLAAIRKTKKWLPSSLVNNVWYMVQVNFWTLLYRQVKRRRKKFSVKCWSISHKKHHAPAFLLNSAIWIIPCSVTVSSERTTFFRSTGCVSVTLCIVRRKRKTVSARHVSVRSGKDSKTEPK
jgi:hypothetical protein